MKANFIIENLVQAEKKAQKAQDTSQLSSDSEVEISSTREKKLPARFRYSSDEEFFERLPRKQREKLGKQNKHPIVPSFPEFQSENL